MKFLTTGLLAALFSFASTQTTSGNMRALQVQNCNTFDSQGNCILCNLRYVLINGQCVAVSDQCQTWDSTTGECTSCYNGYKLKDGECIIKGGGSGSGICNFRQVWKYGKCVDVSDQCKTWNPFTGDCTSCYRGYSLVNGCECVVGNSGVGTEDTCTFRQVLIDHKCVNVSDQCKTWDPVTAACTSCYQGYVISNSDCVIGDSGQGQACYFRQVRINGQCVNVSDLCQTWDAITGDCTSCYQGYTLNNGVCTISR